jgi:RHS repeat-associated protein
VQESKDGKPTSELKTTFYGWDGDRLVLTEEGDRHTHTIYEPNSFIPLIRIEGPKQAPMQTLAQKFEQHTGIKLIEQNVKLFSKIEQQLRNNDLDPEIEHYLRKTGTTPQMMRDMLDDWPTLEGKTIHFYHCDHLGTPLALINKDGEVDWSVELDAWGNVIKEHNPKGFQQPIRFQGQHYDQESGLHYNRYRYYDPKVGRYINQDPIGLDGGANIYGYVGGNPLSYTDPLGDVRQGGQTGQWWEYTDRNFQRWFHLCIKQPGDPDATRADLADAYEQWIEYGKPDGKNGCGGPPPAPALGKCPETEKDSSGVSWMEIARFGVLVGAVVVCVFGGCEAAAIALGVGGLVAATQ